MGDEEDVRARFFQRVAREMREHTEEMIFFYDRNLYRMRQLKRDIAGVCNQLDDTTSQLRRECTSKRQLEKENGDLIEQLCEISVAMVNGSVEHERRLSYATKKTFNACMISLVVVAYICCVQFRICF